MVTINKAFGIKGEIASYSDAFDNEGNGFYLESKYNVAPLVNMSDELNFLVRYDFVDTLVGDSSKGEVTRTEVGLNFRPSQQLVYKVAYHFNNGEGDLDTEDAIYASVAVGF